MIVQRHGIEFDMDALAEICRRYHVRELSLFGSVLRDDFRADSDVDVLIEFEPQARMGLFTYFDLQHELENLIGRNVDLVMKTGLKHVIRNDVLAASEVVYAEPTIVRLPSTLTSSVEEPTLWLGNLPA